jgi:hypothetical protein
MSYEQLSRHGGDVEMGPVAVNSKNHQPFNIAMRKISGLKLCTA